MTPIVLVGGGGHCKSCIDVIEAGGRYKIEGIVDLKEKRGEKVFGYEIFASDEDFNLLQKEFKIFHITIGQIGSPDFRLRIFRELKKYDIQLPSIVSPFAYVSKHCSVSDGCIIMHHAVVNAGATIGMNCIINTKALIEHDAIIGDFCHIATGAIVNGESKVGDQSFIGSGAVLRQNSVVPENSFIKAGSVYKT